MAELQFIMTPVDSREFAAFVFSEFESDLVIDESDRPVPSRLRTTGEFDAFLSATKLPPLLFVLSPSWTFYPLSTFEVNTNDGRRFFAVHQRYGGPAFTWMLSRVSMDGQFLTQGMFGDYPWYFIRVGEPSRIARPQSMAVAIRHISKYVRRNFVRSHARSSGKPGPWVAPDALRLHSSGTILGASDDWAVDAG